MVLFKNGEEIQGAELGENVSFLFTSSWQMWPHVGGGPWACAHNAHWLIRSWFRVSCSIFWDAFCEPTKRTYTITCDRSSSLQDLSSSLPTFYFIRACLDAYCYYWIWSLQQSVTPPPLHVIVCCLFLVLSIVLLIADLWTFITNVLADACPEVPMGETCCLTSLKLQLQ